MDISKDNDLKNNSISSEKSLDKISNGWKDSITSASVNLQDNADQMSDGCSNLPSRLPSIALNQNKKYNSQSSLPDDLSQNNDVQNPEINGINLKRNIKDLEINDLSLEIASASSNVSTPLIPKEQEKPFHRQSSMTEEYFARRVRRKDVNDEGLLSYHSSLRRPRTTEGIMAFESAIDTPSITANTPFIIPPFYDDSDPNQEEPQRGHCLSIFCSNIRGDETSLALLLILYFLQGIPLGIIGCIPYMLSERNVSFTDQSFFSFSSYPFSAKLLWAPIVDSFYIKKIGRRKTWLIPTQFLISVYLFVLSFYISDLIPEDHTKSMTVSIKILTLLFLPLNFLAATQDIAVDGWALTMLSRKNVGYASTCNVIGQHAGLFLGNNVFMFLSSEKYANRFFRVAESKGGLINFAG